MCIMTGGQQPRDPHARPADPGVRQLDPARARRRTTRRARRDRADAARARHVRARRPAASAARALPLLPRRRATSSSASTASSYGWVAPGRGGLRPRGRVRPRPGVDAKLIYIKASDAPRRAPRRASSPASSPTTPPPTSRSDTAEELEERIADDLATLLAERFDASRREPTRPSRRRAPAAACRRRTRRRSGASATSRAVRDLLAEAATAAGEPHRPRRHRQEPARDRGGRCDARDLFRDGVVFVPLEGVLEPATAAADDRATRSASATPATAPLEERIAQRARRPARC